MGSLVNNRASMPRLAFLLPGDLDVLTGGTIYDRHIVHGLRSRSWPLQIISLGSGYPWPDAATSSATAAAITALPDGTCVVADGLAFGVMADIVAQHAHRLLWVALVHHPLALETGLDAAQRQQLLESERQALALTRGVIVTSAHTATALASYGVPAARIRVVEPGTTPAALSTRSTSTSSHSDQLKMLCVATLTPRKGHAVLLEALGSLQDRRWSLDCVGSTERDPATTHDLRRRIEALALGHRVKLHGEVDGDALQTYYADADVFVLPSYHEGYGMALAEALAHGLPVVSTTAGAITGTVPADAGVFVPPGDSTALRAALVRLIDEPAWRAQLAAGARAARSRLRDWPFAVERFAAALDQFVLLALDRVPP